MYTNITIKYKYLHIITVFNQLKLIDQLGQYEQFVTKLFGYDRVFPMTTSLEALETAIKLWYKNAILIIKAVYGARM